MNYNVNDQEYLCPMCEKLCNAVLPIAPPTSTCFKFGNASTDSFGTWMTKGIPEILDNLQPPSKNLDDMSAYRFQGDLLSPATKAVLKASVKSMMSNFAVNTTTVSCVLVAVVLYSACGGIRTDGKPPVLTAYFPFNGLGILGKGGLFMTPLEDDCLTGLTGSSTRVNHYLYI